MKATLGLRSSLRLGSGPGWRLRRALVGAAPSQPGGAACGSPRDAPEPGQSGTRNGRPTVRSAFSCGSRWPCSDPQTSRSIFRKARPRTPNPKALEKLPRTICPRASVPPGQHAEVLSVGREDRNSGVRDRDAEGLSVGRQRKQTVRGASLGLISDRHHFRWADDDPRAVVVASRELAQKARDEFIEIMQHRRGAAAAAGRDAPSKETRAAVDGHSPMKSAVLVFPGINRERDMARALRLASGNEPAMVWHAETALPAGTDLVVIPGGFSYGDYLRCGRDRGARADHGCGAGPRRPRRPRARRLQRLPDPVRVRASCPAC